MNAPLEALTKGQRALLAARMVDASKRHRAAWMKAARDGAPTSSAANCEACGRYAGFTHLHHIVPLAMQFVRGLPEAKHDVVPLCPTHHVIVHALIDIYRGNGKRRPHSIPDDEADRCRAIAIRALGEVSA